MYSKASSPASFTVILCASRDAIGFDISKNLVADLSGFDSDYSIRDYLDEWSKCFIHLSNGS
jgi:hypothetical protein